MQKCIDTLKFFGRKNDFSRKSILYKTHCTAYLEQFDEIKNFSMQLSDFIVEWMILLSYMKYG